jgi:hypothetical protein
MKNKYKKKGNYAEIYLRAQPVQPVIEIPKAPFQLALPAL